MKRHYFVTKTGRVIPPLPAPIKEELEDKGVTFEENGIADYRVIGKEVRIKFMKKDEMEEKTD